MKQRLYHKPATQACHPLHPTPLLLQEFVKAFSEAQLQMASTAARAVAKDPATPAKAVATQGGGCSGSGGGNGSANSSSGGSGGDKGPWGAVLRPRPKEAAAAGAAQPCGKAESGQVEMPWLKRRVD
jgi:hypothetical protein